MKKRFQFLFFSFLLFLTLFPTMTFASRYDLEETDVSLLLNDETWYVFTRGNIKDNEELEELGITYDYLSNFMEEYSVYLDAVNFSSDLESTVELFVRKKSGSKVDNLSNYSKSDMKELVEELAKKQDSPISEIYENDYKFIYLEYQDGDYNIIEYYTIINHDAYTVTIQKANNFTEDERVEFKKIIDSIIFESDSPTQEKKDSWEVEPIIIGAITGAIVGLIVYFQNRGEKIKL